MLVILFLPAYKGKVELNLVTKNVLELIQQFKKFLTIVNQFTGIKSRCMYVTWNLDGSPSIGCCNTQGTQ